MRVGDEVEYEELGMVISFLSHDAVRVGGGGGGNGWEEQGSR